MDITFSSGHTSSVQLDENSQTVATGFQPYSPSTCLTIQNNQVIWAIEVGSHDGGGGQGSGYVKLNVWNPDLSPVELSTGQDGRNDAGAYTSSFLPIL